MSADPFKDLAPSTFDMEAWKRFYSCNDSPKAIEYFWQNLDKEGYSLWKCDYKHNDELKMTFMSANYIGGVIQRLDSFRKYGFASMCVFGENNNNFISGVFLVRGQDLPFSKNEDWANDYELFNWTKLNPESEADKKTVEEFWAWSGDFFTANKFAQGKIFK